MLQFKFFIGFLTAIGLGVWAWSLFWDLLLPPLHPTGFSSHPIAAILLAAVLAGISYLILKWLVTVKRRMNREAGKSEK